MSDVLTVSEYSSRLGYALREVGAATLEGEVQKVGTSARSGMLYFDLTDGTATLSCKVFGREVPRLAHRPAAGDLVRIQVDRPDLYAVNGSLSLIVSQVTLAGEGELLRRRADLIARLTQEGLCDPTRRRPLPRFPSVVGVIAGEGSHAMSDVVKAIADRWPPAQIITCPSLVQGKAAPRELINALATFQENSLADVIIMARGGGTVQDLACFDDESLCRALFACELPVVCAIGHTDNNPVCNHVTWSAYTPSRSAEMVVPSIVEVRRDIKRSSELVDAVPGKLDVADDRIQTAASRLDVSVVLGTRERDVRQASADVSHALGEFFRAHATVLSEARSTLAFTPRRAKLELTNEHATLAAASATLARTGERVSALVEQTAELCNRVAADTSRQLDDAARDVVHLAELVAARDFRRRGWLLATKAGEPVRSAAELHSGDPLHLQLHDGSAEAVVEQVTS